MENNKLIAEFMGYKLMPCNRGKAWDIGKSIPSKDHVFPIQGVLHTGNELKFNSSWDWLMPVLEKINNSFVEYEHNDKGIVNGLVKGKDGEWVDDRINRVHNAVLQFNIDITYQAVVEFIKWHNLNK